MTIQDAPASRDQSKARQRSAKIAEERPSIAVHRPIEHRAPVVIASPHSGTDYRPEFLAASRLDPAILRRSEDAFVNEIVGAAPRLGMPLIEALFPRVYVDPNREPYELDPAMFREPLPSYVNASSPRVAAGLGTVARVVATGAEIYPDALSISEVMERLEACYFPYHNALRDLLDQTFEQFGCYLLIDCHSMPSVGGPMDLDPGLRRVDIVLGDCHGRSCDPRIVSRIESVLARLGYTVRRNLPYAGGYTTRYYGRPLENRHALQIEINRALYMDEERIVPNRHFEQVVRTISTLLAVVAEIDPDSLIRR